MIRLKLSNEVVHAKQGRKQYNLAGAVGGWGTLGRLAGGRGV